MRLVLPPLRQRFRVSHSGAPVQLIPQFTPRSQSGRLGGGRRAERARRGPCSSALKPRGRSLPACSWVGSSASGWPSSPSGPWPSRPVSGPGSGPRPGPAWPWWSRSSWWVGRGGRPRFTRRPPGAGNTGRRQDTPRTSTAGLWPTKGACRRARPAPRGRELLREATVSGFRGTGVMASAGGMRPSKFPAAGWCCVGWAWPSRFIGRDEVGYDVSLWYVVHSVVPGANAFRRWAGWRSPSTCSASSAGLWAFQACIDAAIPGPPPVDLRGLLDLIVVEQLI